MKGIALCLAVLAGVSGCMFGEKPPNTPQYRTEYLFEGPSTEAGQLCVVRCENVKERCRSTAEVSSSERYRQCEVDAQNEYESCAMRTTSFSERRLCYRKSCPVSADYVSCETPYHACFENCGGVVWTRRVCEANC